MRAIKLLYIVVFLVIVIVSYGFVDPNFPILPPEFLSELVYQKRLYNTILYIAILVCLFVLYGNLLHRIQKKKITSKDVWSIIALASAVLFFAFPALSNDIFNYIATAKVAFLYGENPYIVMPIEITKEPMLAFLHAANKTALYGPSWIGLTLIPHTLSFGNLLLSVFTFKALVIGSYLGLSYLIWVVSKRSALSLAAFALNPLVLIETLVSGHNDAVMMLFALLSFYLLKKQKGILSVLFLFVSIGIKYATVFLIPVYLYVIISLARDKEIIWDKIWLWSAMLMYLVFFLSPVREEFYPWYFIWPFTFAVLVPKKKALLWASVVLSSGLMFRYAPWLYTREWGGITPIVKKIVTITPLLLVLLWYLTKKRFSKTR